MLYLLLLCLVIWMDHKHFLPVGGGLAVVRPGCAKIYIHMIHILEYVCTCTCTRTIHMYVCYM